MSKVTTILKMDKKLGRDASGRILWGIARVWNLIMKGLAEALISRRPRDIQKNTSVSILKILIFLFQHCAASAQQPKSLAKCSWGSSTCLGMCKSLRALRAFAWRDPESRPYEPFYPLFPNNFFRQKPVCCIFSLEINAIGVSLYV